MNDEIVKVKLPSGPVLNIHKDQHSEWVWDIKIASLTIGESHKGFGSREDCINNLVELGKVISVLKTDGSII